jgi:hypothetical protein
MLLERNKMKTISTVRKYYVIPRYREMRDPQGSILGPLLILIYILMKWLAVLTLTASLF